MKLSRLFVSGTAAAAVIGAIGFAYAQNTPYSSSGTSTNQQTQNQGMTPAQSTTGSSPGMQNPSPGTSTGSMNNDSTGMSNNTRPGAAGMTTDSTRNMGNERLARADRN